MFILIKRLTKISVVAITTIMISTTVFGQATTAGCNTAKSLTQPTVDAATGISTGGSTKPLTCGNGVLDDGECCDLGTAMNGSDKIGGGADGRSPDGKTDHGCHSNCSVDTKGGWDCNDPAQGFSGYVTWVGAMHKLYNALLAANSAAGLVATKKCNNAPGQGGRVDDPAASNTFSNGNEQTGAVTLTTCVDYETALARFQGYNSSHPISSSVYQSTTNIPYRGNLKNYNTCIAPGVTNIAAGVNVDRCL